MDPLRMDDGWSPQGDRALEGDGVHEGDRVHVVNDAHECDGAHEVLNYVRVIESMRSSGLPSAGKFN